MKCGEFRPEFGLEGEQQDQAHRHRGREEEERQRGRAGKIKGQDHQVDGEQPQEQRADDRRDMAIRVKGFAQKMRPDGGDDRQQEGRIQEDNLGIGHQENTLGCFLAAFLGDRRGHGLVAGWVGHADFLSISRWRGGPKGKRSRNCDGRLH